MAKRSRKHHYLPRHYLKGFVDKEGAFFVYDKETEKIFKTSPDSSFFENDLNTVTLPNGEKSDFVEKLYAHSEGRYWESLNRVRASSLSQSVSVHDKMELYFFLSFLHWRLPSNSIHAEELSARFFQEDRELGFVKLTRLDGTSPSTEELNNLRSSPAWQKASRMFLPFAPFFSGTGWSTTLEDWRFLRPTDGASWYLVGDNPIVTEGQHDHDPIMCLHNFFFPVAGNVLLVSKGDKTPNPLPPEFTVQFGAAIIERAQRFVACHDRDYLSALLGYYHSCERRGVLHQIIPELHEMVRA